ARSKRHRSGGALGKGVAGKFVRCGNRACKKEGRSKTASDFRLLRAQTMVGAEGCAAIAGERRPGLSRSSPSCRALEKGNQSAGEDFRKIDLQVCAANGVALR